MRLCCAFEATPQDLRIHGAIGFIADIRKSWWKPGCARSRAVTEFEGSEWIPDLCTLSQVRLVWANPGPRKRDCPESRFVYSFVFRCFHWWFGSAVYSAWIARRLNEPCLE